MLAPPERYTPIIAKVEKSTVSNTSNAADHTIDGRYNTIGAHNVGKIHATVTNNNNMENIALTKGTNTQFKSSDQPDKDPTACKQMGAVAICAAIVTDKKETTARRIRSKILGGEVSSSNFGG